MIILVVVVGVAKINNNVLDVIFSTVLFRRRTC